MRDRLPRRHDLRGRLPLQGNPQRGGVVANTALNPALGYEASSRIAKRALEENRSVYDLVLEEKLLDKEEPDELLQPEQMIRPHKFYRKK
ncbi:MAG: hypothetical protein LBG30_05370 [Odoribacteraceae bacterium]|nr:hypothetical protein [Odoribacteraceae bacterium]